MARLAAEQAAEEAPQRKEVDPIIVMNDEHRAIVNHLKPLTPELANLRALEQSPGAAAPKLLDSMVEPFENKAPIY